MEGQQAEEHVHHAASQREHSRLIRMEVRAAAGKHGARKALPSPIMYYRIVSVPYYGPVCMNLSDHVRGKAQYRQQDTQTCGPQVGPLKIEAAAAQEEVGMLLANFVSMYRN